MLTSFLLTRRSCLKTSLVYLITGLFFWSCSGKSKVQIQQPVSARDVKMDAAADFSQSGDAYEVDTLFVEKDELIIRVHYQGGCKSHDFELIGNGRFAKSLPPQTSILLKHSRNGESCKKLINETLRFGITPLRYPGITQKSVLLKLGTRSVTYNY